MQEQLPVTLLVMGSFLILPGAPRARLKAPTFGAWTFGIQLRFLGLLYKGSKLRGSTVKTPPDKQIIRHYPRCV